MREDMEERIRQRLRQLRLKPRTASLRVSQNPDLFRQLLRPGGPDNPRIDTLEKVSAALETTVEWLMHGDGAGPPQAALPAGAAAGRARVAPSEIGHADLALPPAQSLGRDVPVFGTAAGSIAGSFVFEGGPVDYVRRPSALAGASDIYAIYVTGSSMEPEHRPGDLRFVHPHRQPQIGDTVIVQCRYAEAGDIQAFIKRLLARREDIIVTEQLNPAGTVEFRAAHVIALHKVLTTNDLFGV